MAFILVSCEGSANKKGENEVVVIDDFASKKLKLSDFVEVVKTYQLETDSFMIGDVGDLCVYDSIMFFFDNLTSNLVAYDLRSQSIKQYINNKGAGPLEYIRPHALAVDENGLYLLDSTVRKIICYNHLLEPQREINLNFSAFDFIKVENGFLLCVVLPDSSIDYKKIIYIDMSGNILDSFIHTHQYGMIFGKSFLKSANNDIYVGIPYSNQIYEWKDECLNEYCYTDFGKLNIPQEDREGDLSYYDSEYLHNNNFFVMPSFFINAFLYDNKMHYHFKEHATAKKYAGVMVNDINGLPFFPRWQYKNYLIGLCRLGELPASDNWKADYEGVAALFFKMK